MQDNILRLDVRRVNRMLTMLINYMKELDDEGRELPIRWNIMHMYSSCQLATLITLKRGINPEIAGLAAALHDIGVVMTKKRENHAREAKQYVIDFINVYNDRKSDKLKPITEEESNQILDAIINHSDKDVISNNKLVELVKDVDSLDRYLHGVETKGDHLKRCKSLLEELGIN